MLVRGRIYVLRDDIYENSVPRLINAADMAHLRRYAVDQIHLEGEQEFQRRQKFKFLTTAQADEQRLKNIAEGAPDDRPVVDVEADEDEDEVPTPRRSRARNNG
jgi:hypothetical protein